MLSHRAMTCDDHIVLQLIAHPLSKCAISAYFIAIFDPPLPPLVSVGFMIVGVSLVYLSVTSIWDNMVRHLVDDGVLGVRNAS